MTGAARRRTGVMAGSDIARAYAEIEAERKLQSILRSLRSDPTAESLRGMLLSGVLDVPWASTDKAVADAPPSRVAPCAGRGTASDLFAQEPAPVPPAGDAPMPVSRPPSGLMRTMVETSLDTGIHPLSDLSISPDGRTDGAEGPQEARPVPGVALEPPQVEGVSWKMRAHAYHVMKEIYGRPATEAEILDKATPDLRDAVLGFKPGYLRILLTRHFIWIGRDRFWPRVELPPGLGFPHESERRGLVATVPLHADGKQADEAIGLIEAYNATVEDPFKLGIAPLSKHTRKAIENGTLSRLP
jgi:hypothetical protein